jgi:hypothetical protein
VRSLAVLGNLSRDVVDGGTPRVGGAPYYAAQALRVIGFPGRIATKCAPPDRGLLRQVAALGVPVSWRPAATTAGFRVSFDGQGLVRPGRTGPLELDAEFDPELLRHVRVLKLAEEEAEVIGDVTSLGVPEIVVTLGARGSLVWWRGRLEPVPAQPARVSDPTGAGDAFAVVYLSARVVGYQPAAAARRASQVVAGLLR